MDFSTEEEGHELFGFIIVLTLMSIYVIIGTYMETNHCCFGHETGVVIILGILVAYAMTFSGKDVFEA